MILVFDTETSGVPKNYKAPISDLDNWPRLVQIGWAFYNDGVLLGSAEYIIKPDGFTIPDRVSRIHGITTEVARLKGISLQEALSRFTAAVGVVPCLVGHNTFFDRSIIGAEFLRCDMENVLLEKPHICTMKASTDYCKLPGRYNRYKWPKLQELYKVLFKQEMGAAHTALVDVEATATCFFELVRLGVIDYPRKE